MGWVVLCADGENRRDQTFPSQAAAEAAAERTDEDVGDLCGPHSTAAASAPDCDTCVFLASANCGGCRYGTGGLEAPSLYVEIDGNDQ